MDEQPLQQINNAHMRDCSNTNSSRAGGTGQGARAAGAGRGGTGSSRGKKAQQGPPSVTSVVFIDEYVLASAGANDGAVKLWDLRKSWNSEVIVGMTPHFAVASFCGASRTLSPLCACLTPCARHTWGRVWRAPRMFSLCLSITSSCFSSLGTVTLVLVITLIVRVCQIVADDFYLFFREGRCRARAS